MVAFLVEIVTHFDLYDNNTLRFVILVEHLFVSEFDQIILQMVIGLRRIGQQKIRSFFVINWKKLCSNDHVLFIIQRIEVVHLLLKPCEQHVLHPCESQIDCAGDVFVFIAQFKHKDQAVELIVADLTPLEALFTGCDLTVLDFVARSCNRR